MNRFHQRRFLTILLVLIAIGFAATLSLYALKQNINLFYSPAQIVLDQAPQNQEIRLGGLVENGSIQRKGNGLTVQFLVTDNIHKVLVNYTGLLPDLFRAGQSVVVQGKLNSQNILMADQVLAKHDEKYMPAQVKSILEKKGYLS